MGRKSLRLGRPRETRQGCHLCSFRTACWMVADAEFGEHFCRMLSGLASGTNWSGGRAAELPWQPVNVKTAPMWCVDFDDMLVAAHLRMIAELVETHHGTVRDFLICEPDHPPGRWFAFEAPFENFYECSAIAHSHRIAGEALVGD